MVAKDGYLKLDGAKSCQWIGSATGKEPDMPRELTRQEPQLRIVNGGLDYEIIDCGNSVRVVLSGSFDLIQLGSVINKIKPHLIQRNRRLILDGSELSHVDYRIIGTLTSWNALLCSFGHKLLLANWSNLHKTILLVGDSRSGKNKKQLNRATV